MIRLDQLIWLTILCVSTTIVTVESSNHSQTVDVTAIVCKTIEVAGLIAIANLERSDLDRD
jgi:hypothetical protein